ncbi:MAG TPA: phosphatase PAP2 family protein [Candidatus Saccharimonadales bacterium]
MNELIVKILADVLVVPIVVIGVWALLMIPNNKKYHAYGRILMAGLTAYLAAKLIGAVFQPETMRPFEKLGVEAGASFLNNPGFPSDHVLFCVAISLAVWFETRQIKTSIILIVLTVLVAVGRIVGLVHTPLDVIGGIAIACMGIPWYLQGDRNMQIIAKSRKNRKKSVE